MLTAAQASLLAMLRKGKSPRQAAEQLGISGTTVYVHLRKCRDRLGAASTEEAVAKAADLGLVSEEADDPLASPWWDGA